MLVLVHVAHVPVAHQWQSVAMKRPSVAIRGHQRPSKAIRGHHQRSSEAIRGHQWPSSRAQVAHVPLLGAQDARVVHLLHLELHGMRIRSGHLQLEAIRGNQRQLSPSRAPWDADSQRSPAIRGNQRQSVTPIRNPHAQPVCL
jgi:hypothetical protein